MRDETNDKSDTDETNEKANAASDALTDEQLDEVAGAASEERGLERDVRLPKSYPPWPGSS